MLKLQVTTQFKKDYKKCEKRGLDMKLLQDVLGMLLNEQPLPDKHHDHALTGNYSGFRECHIMPDWLPIYMIQKDVLILTASRTGTHSDMFGK